MNRMEIEQLLPQDIERRSFEIIERELKKPLDEQLAPIIKRVIHTTADFDYVDNLYFSDHVYDLAMAAIKSGATIITDTNMAKSGINQKALARLGGTVACFMADEEVAEEAKKRGSTRAVVAMEKAGRLEKEQNSHFIYAIGNAPTALMELRKLYEEQKIQPALIIGVPVGFVNVVAAKEMIVESGIPCIVARGRKGGSNVAAAIVNALMYLAVDRDSL